MFAFWNFYQGGFFSDSDFGFYHPPIDWEKAENTENKKQHKAMTKNKRLKSEFKDVKRNLRRKKT